MAKDPAFLFYPNDWLGGTLGMTFEEKGAYMELLMMQFNRGHMTSHMIGQVVGQNWLKIKDKFKQDADGLWYNDRLEKEKEARIKFTKSRNNNLTGTNQFTKKEQKNIGHMDGHMTSHMENENINENEINKTIEYVRITAHRTLSNSQVIEYWKAFLIHKDGIIHLSHSDKIRHFRNWIKIQKDATNLNGTPKSSKSAGANELAEQLNAKLAARGTANP